MNNGHPVARRRRGREGRLRPQPAFATFLVSTSAYEELQHLATKLWLSDRSLTEAQSFARVYEDPANLHLVQRERAERLAKIAARAESEDGA
jgi:hypothetical protein